MSTSSFSDNEVLEKSIRMENQAYENTHDRIANQFKEILEPFGDSATPAVLDLANLPSLREDGYFYTTEQVLLNTLLSKSEYVASDMPESIAGAFVNLFMGIQLKFFAKGRILLYKDGKITITTGKPPWYNQEPLLWHRLNKIIVSDQCDGEIDLLNPSHRITWCQVKRVWSLKQFKNFNEFTHTGLRNGSHMIIWSNNGHDVYIKEYDIISRVNF